MRKKSIVKKRQRTKDNLIPFEKSKRIITLDKRGRQNRTRNVAAVIMGVLAVLCMLYCASIFFFLGFGTRFFLIWGVLALACAGLAFLLRRPKLTERIPRFLRIAFWCCVVLGAALFVLVESMILSEFDARAEAGADYLIVLGAQWKDNGPSYVLQKRLDAAVTYLTENPDTIVIVSGGQGINEPLTEAAGMAQYLEAAGIEPERILQEDASTDTSENLMFSSALLDKTQDRVVIVTNNFHLFRALKIAEKQGYLWVEGIAADSYPAMLPNNLLREFLGVMKDFFVCNL
jgi:uncharacterized SAM-binding protein YcdF (DUF218 family)